jgi:hypothetical protein
VDRIRVYLTRTSKALQEEQGDYRRSQKGGKVVRNSERHEAPYKYSLYIPSPLSRVNARLHEIFWGSSVIIGDVIWEGGDAVTGINASNIMSQNGKGL